MFFIVKADRGQLVEIGRGIDAGELVAVCETAFRLEDMREAYLCTMHSHHRGKSALLVEG